MHADVDLDDMQWDEGATAARMRIPPAPGRRRALTTLVSTGAADMERRGAPEHLAYHAPCRCSGVYTITVAELEAGYSGVACSSCSLRVRVLYRAVDETDPTPEE